MPDLAYDLHIHSCLSPCGDEDMTPANIAGMAMIKGLRIIALTDHNTARNAPALIRAAEPYGITDLPGMELTTEEKERNIFLIFSWFYLLNTSLSPQISSWNSPFSYTKLPFTKVCETRERIHMRL